LFFIFLGIKNIGKFKKYLKQINKKMDSLIGIKGKDFIILAADTFNAYSVLKMKVFTLIKNLALR